MAIYHFSIKTISRSRGRSATASAAYRSGTKIKDFKTGEMHNYCRKKGVVYSAIVLPLNAPQWAANRELLWNAAEAAEKRSNSTVAREFEVALPAELPRENQIALINEFAQKIVARHHCAVDFAIHEPSNKGDQRNSHAHILLTTRRLSADGLTEKTRELDNQKSGEVQFWRKEWADNVNQHLFALGCMQRVSHESLKEQGIDRCPTRHIGVAATAIMRRGELSEKEMVVDEQVTMDFEPLEKELSAERKLLRRDEAVERLKYYAGLRSEPVPEIAISQSYCTVNHNGEPDFTKVFDNLYYAQQILGEFHFALRQYRQNQQAYALQKQKEFQVKAELAELEKDKFNKIKQWLGDKQKETLQAQLKKERQRSQEIKQSIEKNEKIIQHYLDNPEKRPLRESSMTIRDAVLVRHYTKNHVLAHYSAFVDACAGFLSAKAPHQVENWQKQFAWVFNIRGFEQDVRDKYAAVQQVAKAEREAEAKRQQQAELRFWQEEWLRQFAAEQECLAHSPYSEVEIQAEQTSELEKSIVQEPEKPQSQPKQSSWNWDM